MFDGAYHGSATLFLPGSPDVVRMPWNDLDATAALLGRPGHDIAAVFAEPFLGAGGVRPAAPGFLAAVAALARDHDVLFVLDEVQGLRNGPGGEQGRLGLTPDLTLLGKIIGGGFPIGAVGGRTDLLELTVATMTPGYVAHAGTFNGHLAAAVAGVMTLRHLDAAAIARLNDAAASLAERILAGASVAGVPAEVTRAGSIMNVHLDAPGQLADLHLALLLNGVYTTPRGMINLSTALSPADLDDIAAAYATAFTMLASSSVRWTLGQPGIAQDRTLAQALYWLDQTLGGSGFSVPFGLLIGGVAVTAAFHKLLPKWMVVAGATLEVIGELSWLNLLTPKALFLVPLTRFPGFAWLIAVGLALPNSIERATPAGGERIVRNRVA